MRQNPPDRKAPLGDGLRQHPGPSRGILESWMVTIPSENEEDDVSDEERGACQRSLVPVFLLRQTMKTVSGVEVVRT